MKKSSYMTVAELNKILKTFRVVENYIAEKESNVKKNSKFRKKIREARELSVDIYERQAQKQFTTYQDTKNYE